MAEAARINKSCRKSYTPMIKMEPFYSGGTIEISQDGEYLYTAMDENITETNLKNGTQRQILCDIGQITCFALSPNGKYFSCASRNSIVSLCDAKDHKKIRNWNLGQDLIILCMKFDCTSRLLVFGTSGGIIKVWDVETNYCTHILKGHSEAITSISFHPQPKRELLVSCSKDCTVRLWDLKNNKKNKNNSIILTGHKSTVVNVFFSNDGNHLISGGRDNQILVWDINLRKIINSIVSNDTIESIEFVPQFSPLYDDFPEEKGVNRTLVCTLNTSGIIRIWDSKTGCVLIELDHKDTNKLYRSVGDKFLISRTTEMDISVHKFDKNLTVLHKKTGSPADVLSLSPLSYSDPHYLAVATSSNRLRLFNAINKECFVSPPAHSSVIMCVAVNIDLQMIATGGRDENIFLWKYAIEEGRITCHLYASCPGHAGNVNSIKWSKLPGETLISASADCTIKLWTLPRTKKKQQSEKTIDSVHELIAARTIVAHDKEVQGVDFSNDKKLFATASLDKTAKLWNLSTGELLGTFKGHSRGIWCVKFSNTDMHIATGSADKTIRLWNVNDYTCIGTFEGHLNSVVELCFIKSSSQIVSCGSDAMIKIWDVKSSTCQKTLGDHQDRIWTIATFNDGEFLISGSSDESIIVWKDVSEEEEALKRKEHNELILLEQNLSNTLLQKNYHRAIRMLLHLDHQQKSLDLVRELIECSFKDYEYFKNVIVSLSDEELSKLLVYCRNWNTNWRYMHVAQVILNCIVTSIPMKRITSIKDAYNIISTIRAYSESHYKSLDDFHTDIYILDYLIEKSTGIHPGTSTH